MRRLWVDGLKALLRGGIEALAVFPLMMLLLFALESRGGLALLAGGMALAYALGFALRRRFHWSRTGVLLGVSFLSSVLIGWGWHGVGFRAVILAVPVGIWMYRGMRSWDRGWYVEFPIIFHWLAVAIYFVGSFLTNHIDRLASYGSLMTWLGLSYVIVVLLLTNEELIHMESLSHLGRSGATGSVRRQNRALVSAVLAVWLLLGSIGLLRQALAWLGEQFTAGLKQLVSWLESFGSEPPASPMGEPKSMFPMTDPPAVPSPFWEALNQFLYAIAMGAAGLAALWLLYVLARRVFKLLRLLYRKLAEYLSDHAQEEDKGYIDESERLFDLRKTAATTLGRIRLRLARPEREASWEELKDNRERARYLFLLMVRRRMANGYEYKPYFTPLETTAELNAQQTDRPDEPMNEVGRIYTKARYGAEPISDAEIASIRGSVQALEKRRRAVQANKPREDR